MFRCAELCEGLKESYHTFVNVLNNVCINTVDESTEKLKKDRFIDQSDVNCPSDVLHMYSENAPAVFGNQTVLSNLPGEFYSIKSIEKIQNDCRHPFSMIQAAQNQKQTNTEGLGKLLLKIDAKAVLPSVQIFKIT